MKRIHEFDSVRVLANLMRMVLHCMVPYMVTNHGFWFFKSGYQHLGADYITYVMHALIMEIFMLVSGYLSPVSGDGKPMAGRLWRDLLFPWLFAWCITMPFLYYLNGVETGTGGWRLFIGDLSSRRIHLLQFWYLEYLVLFTVLLYKIKTPQWWWGLLLMAVGWALNDEMVIRTPKYVGIELPGFIYFAGWFLLGRALGNINTPLNTIPPLAIRVQVVLFAVCFIVCGLYMKLRLDSELSGIHLLLFKLSALGTPLFGCTALLQGFGQLLWRPPKWMLAGNYFTYLFHLPIAVAIQFGFHLLGVQSVMAPVAVVLLSIGSVYALSAFLNTPYFALCKWITGAFIKKVQ
ncbi:MAG: hypothetical protein JXR76_03245 [Deltaproteobacteria bacterium]|nr:hypothetical protein [Deltaproteobacteria bacterium]